MPRDDPSPEEALAQLHAHVETKCREIPFAREILARIQEQVLTEDLPRAVHRFVYVMRSSELYNEPVEQIRDFFQTHSQEEEVTVTPAFALHPSLYALPASYNLQKLNKVPGIVGINGSSANVVDALQLDRGMSVLDVCCAPGAKLALIADTVAPSGFVIGLDRSFERLSVCRKMVKKNNLRNVALLMMDSSAIDFVSHSWWTRENIASKLAGFWNGWRLRSRRKAVPPHPAVIQNTVWEDFFLKRQREGLKFDRVLCDVECTHDGSIRHVQKYLEKPSPEEDQGLGSRFQMLHLTKHLLNPFHLSRLICMQKTLLGISLGHLHNGGLTVYSTCSSVSAQNEGVVDSVLTPEYALCPLENHHLYTLLKPNELKCTPTSILFRHSTFGTDGLFYCVIRNCSHLKTGTTNCHEARIQKKLKLN